MIKKAFLIGILFISISLFYVIASHKSAADSFLLSDNQNAEYIVVLHGIAKTTNHMQELAEHLHQEGFNVLNLNYPSTKYNMQTLIDKINRKIKKNLPKNKKAQKVHFVGYSMGGLMVRGVINKYRPKNLGRIVLLASPNHGSEIADFLKNNWLYKKGFGPSGQQLVTDNEDGFKKLFGKVDYELGIIAGSASIDPISSYIIDGNDDGKVSIASTKLKGMKEHIIINSSHLMFPSNKEVQNQTANFIKYGKFSTEYSKQQKANSP